MMAFTAEQPGLGEGSGPHVLLPQQAGNQCSSAHQLLPTLTGMLGPGNQSAPLTFFLSSSQFCMEVSHA